MALPGSTKGFDQFRYDDGSCRGYAYDAIGGHTAARAQEDSAVRSALAGAVIGALIGGAVNGGHGAAVGAGVGGAAGGNRRLQPWTGSDPVPRGVPEDDPFRDVLITLEAGGEHGPHVRTGEDDRPAAARSHGLYEVRAHP